jgi:ribosomal protein L7/L12
MNHGIAVAVALGCAGLLMSWLRRGGIVQAPLDPNAPRDMDEVRRLAARGQLIAAIKLHRELTGLGLRESKDAVEAMARGAISSAVPAPASAPNPEADARIKALLSQGQAIEAILVHRQTYGTGLKEAKDAIERLKAQS